MGNFEKLVILTVLFLVATIFGISTQNDAMNQTEPLGNTAEEVAEKPAQPMGENTGKLLAGLVDTKKATKKESAPKTVDPKKASAVNANAKKASSTGTKPAGTVKKASKEIESDKVSQAVSSNGRKPILISTEGLTKSPYDDDYMFYVLEQGDTLTVLANRFYGDRKYKSMIRSDNEGKSLVSGTSIMLARYDFSLDAGNRESFTPAPSHAAPATEKAVPVVAAKAATYTVVEGDSLWKVSLNVYGKGSFWGEIFKANRDQMSDENDVKIGMVLRIPTL